MATRKRRSGMIFFLLALLLIIILAVVVFMMRGQLMALIAPQPEDQQTAEEVQAPAVVMEDVVVTVQSLKRGDIITEEMVGTAPYPQEYMIEGLFFTDIQDVLGRYAKSDMEQGRFLTNADLYEAGQGSFTSFEIPDGMVAITIPIPDKRYLASYAIKAGDYVNILASVQMVDLDQEFQSILPNSVATLFKREVYYDEGIPNNFDADLTLRVDGSNYLGRVYQDPSIPNEYFYVVPTEEQRPRWVTQSLVQNVRVLWVGDLSLEDEADVDAAAETPVEGEAAPTVPEEVIPPNSITIAVSVQDALSLNYLILNNADLNFVLRSAGDNQIVDTEPVTLQFIMDQYNIPYPTKLPYGMSNPNQGLVEEPAE